MRDVPRRRLAAHAAARPARTPSVARRRGTAAASHRLHPHLLHGLPDRRGLPRPRLARRSHSARGEALALGGRAPRTRGARAARRRGRASRRHDRRRARASRGLPVSTAVLAGNARWGSAWQRPLTRGAAAGAAALPFVRFGMTGHAAVLAVTYAVLVTLAVIDIERRILPNVIVLPAAALVLAAQASLQPAHA